MPFQSEQQRKMMYAAAEDPAVAKKMGISQQAAQKFIQDSGGKTLKQTVGDAVDKEAPGVMESKAEDKGETMEGGPKDIQPSNSTPNELQLKSKVPAKPQTAAKGKMKAAAPVKNGVPADKKMAESTSKSTSTKPQGGY